MMNIDVDEATFEATLKYLKQYVSEQVDDCSTEVPPSPYHDTHYNGCIIEPILLMQQHLTKEQIEGFLLGNIIKYRVRAGHKDDAQKDIDKAMRYEQWLREFQEKGTITL